MWQSTTKLIQTHKVKRASSTDFNLFVQLTAPSAPRKSLPLKFSPFPNQSRIMFGSPDSDCSEFSPNPSNPSPSPSLRNHTSTAAPKESYVLNAPVGLGRPTSSQTRIPTSNSSPTMSQPGGLFDAMSLLREAICGICIESKLWFTPVIANPLHLVEDWRFPSPSMDNGHAERLIHRKSVTFVDSSPLTRRSSAVGFGGLASPGRDTIVSSTDPPPSSRYFPPHSTAH